MTGDIEPAQKHFPAVLEMGAPEDLRCLARNGLREMAARDLKARGPRMDGGLLSGWERRLFRGKSLHEVQGITFEIGILSLTITLSGCHKVLLLSYTVRQRTGK